MLRPLLFSSCLFAWGLLVGCQSEQEAPDELKPAGEGGEPSQAPGGGAKLAVQLGDELVRVHQPLSARCVILDEDGQEVQPRGQKKPRLIIEPVESLAGTESAQRLIITQPGEVQLRCEMDGYEPSEIVVLDVKMARPVQVKTLLSVSEVRAGEPALATCLIEDEYGNSSKDVLGQGWDLELRSSPWGGGITIEGMSFVSKKAGEYSLSCLIPGVLGEGANLLVLPRLPSQVLFSKPTGKIRVGSEFSSQIEAVDSYNNKWELKEEDIHLEFTPESRLQFLGLTKTSTGSALIARFEALETGSVTLKICFDGETESEVEVCRSEDLVVEGPLGGG